MNLVRFSTSVLLKAERLVATEGAVIQDVEHPEVWRVRSQPTQVKPYRVQIGYDRTWATCTCEHGLNNGGTPACSHLAAVLMKIEEQER